MNNFSVSIENYNFTILDNTLSCPTSTWKVDAHLHNFYEMHYVLSGSATLYINGKTVVISSNDLLFINKNNLHYPITHSSDLKFVSLSFDINKNNNDSLSFLDYVKIKKYLLGANDFIVFKEKLFKEIFNNLYHNDSNEFLEMGIYQTSLLVFFTFINLLIKNSTLSDEELPGETSRKYKDEIIKIDKYISEHFMEDVKLSELAEKFFISERQMARIFQDLIGEPFHKNLQRQRMNVAITYIKEGKVPLTEIPFLCGFKSYSGFFIAFKKHFGCSPNEYKEMLLKI